MREFTARISGEGVDQISSLIMSELPQAQMREEGGIKLILDERFYLRGMSSLLTVITLRQISSNECHVRIVSGGGSYGLFNLTWGTEHDRNRDMLLLFDDLCTNHDWEIETDTTDWDVPWEQPQDDVSSPSKCLGCGQTVPSGRTDCPACGWSYRNTNDAEHGQ